MQQDLQLKSADFEERRTSGGVATSGRVERRQFRDGKRSANPNVAELADAVDQYKLQHRRRFITYEELYAVLYRTRIPQVAGFRLQACGAACILFGPCKSTVAPPFSPRSSSRQ